MYNKKTLKTHLVNHSYRCNMMMKSRRVFNLLRNNSFYKPRLFSTDNHNREREWLKKITSADTMNDLEDLMYDVKINQS